LDRKIKVAVVGTGELAINSRIPAYLSNKDVELVALVDIDKRKTQRAAKKFGIKRSYTSIEELFEKQDIDTVSICTPPHTHADITIKALDYGAHVLCEKPMANDIKKGKEVFEVSKTKDKILMISSYRRFVPNFQRARERILKGTLGQVYCIEDIQLSPSPLLTWGKSPWYYNEEGGGVLFDLGPHCFDLLNYLYGDFPNVVSATGFSYLDSPVEDCCTCTLEYPENKLAVGTMSWLASASIEKTNIHGTAETLEISPKLFLEVNRIGINEISLWREVSLYLIGRKFPSFPLLHSRGNVDPLKLETDYFIEQIKQDHTNSLNALNALNVLAIIDAAKRALGEQKTIRIESVKQC